MPASPMPCGAAGATVAFESIDGPPLGVFHRLVRQSQRPRRRRARSRSCRARAPRPTACAAISPRRSMRGRTHSPGCGTSTTHDKRRALRIAGEEPAARRRATPGASPTSDAAPDRPREHGAARRLPGESPAAAASTGRRQPGGRRRARAGCRPAAAQAGTAPRQRARRASRTAPAPCGVPLSRFGTVAYTDAEKASGQRTGRIAAARTRLVITTPRGAAVQESGDGGEERSDQARRRQLQSARSPRRSPPTSRPRWPRPWCGASPTWRSSSRSRRTSAAPTCSCSSRPRFRPTTT